jgi:GDP-4-dehydro-6-deoxy-D-mannose reductase
MTGLQVINPMKMLVTGYDGFVGSHFCSAYGGIPLADHEGLVDMRDAGRLRSAVAALAPEAVLHLAAQSSIAQSFSDPMETLSINFLGTFNLLQALSAAGFQGVLVYVGSADVYGKVSEAELPVRETHPLRPRSPYAVSKAAAEALCYQWSQTESFRIVLTRPFTQIGPKQDSRFAIAGFARQIVKIRRGGRPPVLVTGDLDVTRDFTDVRDAVRAYQLLLEGGENGEVYNISSGRERTLRSLAVRLLEIAGVEAELKMDAALLRAAEQRRMVGESTKIKERLGWVSEIPMDKTLTDLLNEMERHSF